MNYDEKIMELENRISKLEKIEKDRRVKKFIGIIFKMIVFALVILSSYKLYLFVRPYFDQFKDIRNTTSGIDFSSETIKDGLNSILNQ